MALHLVTGYAGTEHVTSADQGAYYMGTFGEGQFVLNRGAKFAATVVSNNSVSIADGEALMQGRFIKMTMGTSESVSIDNGTSGMKRNDLIVIRYSKNAGTGIETAALAVIKGTPDATTPADPEYTEGDITDGTDLVNDMPLYRVSLDGINIDSLTQLFAVKTSMVEYMDDWQLPTATSSRLGGVKIPAQSTSHIINDNGSISVPLGTSSTNGVVTNGQGLYFQNDGVLRLKTMGTYSFGGAFLGKGLEMVGDNNDTLKVKIPTADDNTWYTDSQRTIQPGNSTTVDIKTNATAIKNAVNDKLFIPIGAYCYNYNKMIINMLRWSVWSDGYVRIYCYLYNISDNAIELPSGTSVTVYSIILE